MYIYYCEHRTINRIGLEKTFKKKTYIMNIGKLYFFTGALKK
jgi:hypothetical protein